ncbi:hypothetical protein KI387_035429, partial [Taxus chinensis]
MLEVNPVIVFEALCQTFPVHPVNFFEAFWQMLDVCPAILVEAFYQNFGIHLVILFEVFYQELGMNFVIVFEVFYQAIGVNIVILFKVFCQLQQKHFAIPLETSYQTFGVHPVILYETFCQTLGFHPEILHETFYQTLDLHRAIDVECSNHRNRYACLSIYLHHQARAISLCSRQRSPLRSRAKMQVLNHIINAREVAFFKGSNMRRRPGISGLQTAAAARDQYKLLGENVAKLRTDLMKEQLSTFRTQLEDFARKHKNDIKKNPAFRSQFHEMCAKVGVDPLASNKGFWAELLGIGDFYYELGVQIVDICLATRPHNGGLIELRELQALLSKRRRSSREAISEDDCSRAISKLKALGSGFEVYSVGKKKLVRSVPTELNKDHNEILEMAQVRGYIMAEEVERKLGWSLGRATDTLETLLK